MNLATLSALFVVFALSMYVLLDGFDLGVGALLLFEPDERLRDRMQDALAPTWDGNETWLIMAGVGLLAAFPIAYGILLPAFYLPLVAMLLCLGLRGVSFEFRYQTERWRPFWDWCFGIGSIGAALMQGAIVGGLLQGVDIDSERYAGGSFDWVSPFSALTAVTLLAGYSCLGAGWLQLKGQPATRSFAQRRLPSLVLAFTVLAAATCIAAIAVQPGVAALWSAATAWIAALLCIAFLVCAMLVTWFSRRATPARDATPFHLLLLMFTCGLLGLVLTVWPNIVPFRMSIVQAASASASHYFLLIGGAIVTPVVLAYSAFAYWIFRGKTPAQGWEA